MRNSLLVRRAWQQTRSLSATISQRAEGQLPSPSSPALSSSKLELSLRSPFFSDCISAHRPRYSSFRCQQIRCVVTKALPLRPTVDTTSSRPAIGQYYVRYLFNATHYPVWRILFAASTHKRLDLHVGLLKQDLTFEEYSRFKHIMAKSDIEQAVSVLRDEGYTTREQDDQRKHLPEWLLLALVAFKVRTPHHAAGVLLELAWSHLDSISYKYKPGLLILFTLHLARFNLSQPIQRVVDQFLLIRLTPPSAHFNLLLHAMSTSRVRSPEHARLVLRILQAMESRHIKLWRSTYLILLNDRWITLELTKYLRERMLREGRIPDTDHLEAYIRIFAKHGAIEDPAQYRAEVKKFYLSSNIQRRDDFSAFEFLRGMTPQSAPYTRAVNHKPLGFKPQMTDRQWNATFASLARRERRHIPAKGILSLYYKGTGKRRIRPSILTYTSLLRALFLRALFKRGELRSAKQHWFKLVHSGLMQDTRLLSVGLQVLTHIGHPHKAFAFLEQSSARVDVPLRASYRIRQPINVSVVAMNKFILSLYHIKRPDVVFLLWDHMAGMYGVYPDGRTFSLLLQCIRLSLKMDDNLRGALAQLLWRPREPQTREDVVRSFVNLLGDQKPKPYRPGVWKRPVDKVGCMFRWAVFNMKPSLAGLDPPVRLGKRKVDLEAGPGTGMINVSVTTQNCYDYLLLLGLTGKEEEIPYVFGWMKELEIKPTTDMVAMALVFWAEACGLEPGSPWKKLVKWLSEWQGDEFMPDTRKLVKWREIVVRMKGLE
ncbi:uncharacterized protein BT62DRAFT_948476 [Guyanagaster necrorhizus]|uniref:Pentatricopeptide repeat-containing protein n=1 Tax=Guyanagaster necrorhizus TaxID=856835 RepID=A0A9P7VVN3_9AGAR|nr:uncharacterized protein BT62DRAFT_948476 [Guyanagaster necrorhizus MCA 3950]KAG7447402.1 hypothetical protein BT62DRAFT_948476 [Guyanagaster necrorhizus MCA 3950]